MSLSAVRRVLRSPERKILVEAPGGCGKTFEAAELAIDLGTELKEGAEVLLLAHTNAAVQEFMRRVRNSGARVRATTIDAFCLDLLAPYAGPLGLPMPLHRSVGLGAGRLRFDELSPRAVDLLVRCASIATMLAHRYPFVILDEHQDARRTQHRVVAAFLERGNCRVRVFGDPMQAIYEAGASDYLSWEQLSREANAVVALDTPRRWRENPRLGEWILAARRELQAGLPLPLQSAPPCVRIIRLPQLQCAAFGHGNAGAIAGTVRRFMRDAPGTAAILSRHNNHVWGLHIAAGGQLRLNEGAEYEGAYTLIEDVAAKLGNPRLLAGMLVEHLKSVSTGLDAAKERAISSALQADRIEYGRHQIIRDLLLKFEPIYASPDLATFCQVAKSIASDPPTWLTLRMPMSMRLLGQIRPRPQDNGADCLDEVVARFKAGTRRPTRCVSTIHKAKGLEFDHVLIGNFSAAHFGDDQLSRRIAYVALSRARHSVTFLVPGMNASPLLG
jgi:DNA helicase-2/ATP-dependent DNA helicase PcrA